MWLDRLLRRIADANGPVLLAGDDGWGARYLIDALQRHWNVAWVELEPLDENDYVAQGNALADAVNRAVGATLLPKALPFAATVELYRQQRHLLDPLVLALSDAQQAPRLARSLFDLHDGRTRVVVSAASDGSLAPEAALVVIGPDELAVRGDELDAVMAGVSHPERARTEAVRCGGRYGELVQLAQRLRGAGAAAVPGPRGDRLPVEAGLVADPDEVIDALARAGDWVRSLEVAVMSRPARAATLVERAGPAYQRLGLLRRLHLLLEALDPPAQADEQVLTWRLVAAFAVDRLDAVRGEVETYLEAHEAPELRARYAGVLGDPERSLAEAERAARARETPVTLFQVGRLLSDAERAVQTLVRSVDLAEVEGRDYDLVRNAGTLAERLAHLGRFREAVTWGRWALSEYDRRELQDGPRRLRLLNNWAFASVMTGQALGLEGELHDLRTALDGSLPALSAIFRSTLTMLQLSRGQVDAALELAREGAGRMQRRHQGRFAFELVRSLIEHGELDAALREARAAADLNRHDAPRFRAMAQASLGVALALTRPAEARRPLAEAMASDLLPAETRCAAALHWMLATGSGPEALPPAVAPLLRELAPAGLRALSGPESVFRELWTTLSGEDARLILRLVGRPGATLDGREIELSTIDGELLLVLSEHTEGLREERLHALLFGDGRAATRGTLRVRLSRLRERVPVSTAPYRIGVSFATDLQRLRRLVAEGRVGEAVELYSRPLMEGSDVHAAVDARREAEELLRQAVLVSEDVDALLRLASTLEGDLELWTVALERLAPRDPRVVYVRAQLVRFGGEPPPAAPQARW